ncbi:MAG: YraN family protein [Oscillospiraceae bacterium]
MSTREIGDGGEALTAFYLERAGYSILCRNYTVRGGEIDIIAEKDGIIAFVEVKSRDISAFESGVYAVTKRKQRLIIRASQEYLFRIGSEAQPRYDVADVALSDGKPVKLRYFDNAFSADGIDTVL